jgi:Transposase
VTSARPSQVADPFHLVKLANTKLDEYRRQVQNETLGHRGRKADPPLPVPPTAHQGSNLQHALLMARAANRATGSSRIVLVTYNMPSAHHVHADVYFNYPPVPESLEAGGRLPVQRLMAFASTHSWSPRAPPAIGQLHLRITFDHCRRDRRRGFLGSAQ